MMAESVKVELPNLRDSVLTRFSDGHRGQGDLAEDRRLDHEMMQSNELRRDSNWALYGVAPYEDLQSDDDECEPSLWKAKVAVDRAKPEEVQSQNWKCQMCPSTIPYGGGDVPASFTICPYAEQPEECFFAHGEQDTYHNRIINERNKIENEPEAPEVVVRPTGTAPADTAMREPGTEDC